MVWRWAGTGSPVDSLIKLVRRLKVNQVDMAESLGVLFREPGVCRELEGPRYRRVPITAGAGRSTGDSGSLLGDRFPFLNRGMEACRMMLKSPQ